MKLLMDVNVILDVLLDRAPFVDAASRIWRACDEGRAEGLIAACSLPTIVYVVRRQAGIEKAHEAVRVCLEAFTVCTVDRGTLELANVAGDFEDNLQWACAVEAGADFIVTRDAGGFRQSNIAPVTPQDLAARLTQE